MSTHNMSLRRRVKYQIDFFREFFLAWRLPLWVTSFAARAVIIFILVVIGGAYVIETNTLTASGYEIQALEQRIAALNGELEQLNTELAGAQSMANIQRRLNEVKMVAVTNVFQLSKLGDVAMARR